MLLELGDKHVNVFFVLNSISRTKGKYKMKKVRKIEIPKKDHAKKLRVAAYCRVSTKYES